MEFVGTKLWFCGGDVGESNGVHDGGGGGDDDDGGGGSNG